MSASGGIPLKPTDRIADDVDPIYTPIPLPVERESQFNSELVQNETRATDSPSEDSVTPRLSPRADFAKSFVIALMINLIFAVWLCFTFLDLPSLEDEVFLQMQPERAPEIKEEEQGGGAPAPPAETKPASGFPSQAAGSVAMAKSFSAFELPTLPPMDTTALGLSEMGAQLGVEDIGLSLSKADFISIESQKRRAEREFIKGKGARERGGVGIGKGVMKGLFPGSRLGNGENMVLFLDMSGSMQTINRTVKAYVANTFPESKSIEIQGCSLRAADDPFVRALTNAAYSAKTSRNMHFYFVCDLYDGESAEGVGQLRRVLEVSPNYKTLHIISFGEVPKYRLRKLLEDTNGTFTYLDPSLTGDEEEED